jgi:hypothetical protein
VRRIPAATAPPVTAITASIFARNPFPIYCVFLILITNFPVSVESNSTFTCMGLKVRSTPSSKLIFLFVMILFKIIIHEFKLSIFVS